MMNEDVVLAVKKGAEWLDENHPGWEFRIDLGDLQMSNCERCIVGQAVGDYWTVMAEQTGSWMLENGEMWAIEYGFDVPGIGNRAGYRQLEEEWTRVVKERVNL